MGEQGIELEPDLHVDLPSGGYVEFKDYRDFLAGDRKRLMKLADDQIDLTGKNEPSAMTRGYAVTDSLLVLLIDKISVNYGPLAGGVRQNLTVADVEHLRIRDWNAITGSPAVDAAREVLFPESASVDNTAPGSPTLPANA